MSAFPSAMRTACLAMLAMALAGCASTVPEPIRDAPEGAPTPGEVRADPAAFADARLRWGGTIVSVNNKSEFTVVEIVARPLDDSGKPKPVDRSLGRFLGRVPGFLDPAVYDSGRALTVTGTVAGVEKREIGEFPYRFPVIAVDGHYLWPPDRKIDNRGYRGDPYWHDPWYPRSMFYPYCPYGVSPGYCW